MAASRIRQLAAWLGFAMLASIGVVRAGQSLVRMVGSPTMAATVATTYRGCIAIVLIVVTAAAVRRSPPRRESDSALGYVAAAVAVGGLVFLSGGRGGTSGVSVVGLTIAAVAAAWMLVAVVSLGRCFGLLPEARGLVTRGPYAVVRHPVYLGEIGAVVGLAVAAPSLRNLIVLGMFVAAQSVRMRLEEGELRDAFPEYAGYEQATPRLIPRPLRPRGMSSPDRVLPGERTG